MELRHLKYFLALAEELSFIRAAERLYISQPPLSRQIKELEQEVKAQLFNRNNKKVELTEAGKYFEKEIRQVLKSLEKICLKTQKISENLSGEYRIAYISSTFSGNITKLVKYLSTKYPYATFRLYEVSSAEQVLELEQGKLDLGIVRAPVSSPDIKTSVWFRDSYSVVFNKNHINLEEESDIEKLKSKTFVFYNKEYAPFYYQSLLEICARYGFKPKIVHQVNNIASIIQLVKNGLGASIVPTEISKSFSYPEVKYIEIKKLNLFTEVLLATPRESKSEISKTAISYLQRIRK